MNNYFATINVDLKKKISIDEDTTIFIDNLNIHFELIELTDHSIVLKLNNKFYDIIIESKEGDNFSLNYNGVSYEVSIRTALQEKAKQLLESETLRKPQAQSIKSPMPGMIVKINHQAGDQIKRGSAVLVLEAMKMENEIKAPVDCKLKEIFATINTPVEKGQILFSIE